ncbi:E3 ubiquitin/ISG15 ligase TRIM25-like [Hyperolius riggenbachi]|uniref:E3 ubiquitin/ISG15 ligase TRIM25-like n=1 Tax=Hyperolius riggenbachi TaxID=752182 RepID=UPI0035A3428D
MASADVTAELRCSICMEIYRDPVTLPCGHNFCRGCITQAWDHQKHLREYKCPECQRLYRKRPELVRNTTLHNICEAFHAMETDQVQTGVFCNYCDFPVPATKYCLQCETSLCDHHLRKHDRSGGHTLLPPTTDLGNRKCSVHKKILEYYCTEDAACICVSCRLDGEHQGHKVELLDEASEEKKKMLKNALQKLMAETEEAGNKVQSLTERRRKVQENADGEKEKITALFRDLNRQLEDLEKQILSDLSRQASLMMLWFDDIIQELEIKKEELSRKMRHIKELCNMTDPLTVLQESHTGDLCDTEDRERHDKQLHDGGDLDVAGISHTLHTGLSNIMSGVIVQKHTDTQVYPYSSTEDKVPINATLSRPRPQPTPTAQHTQAYPHSSAEDKVVITDKLSRPRPQPTPTTQHKQRQARGTNIGAAQHRSGLSVYADILLDVNTANKYLHISADRKTASSAHRSHKRPLTPERFQYEQALSSQTYSSGRHYWEVDVGGSHYWTVGMCYPSIARRGDQAGIGYNNKSWGLEGLYFQYLVRYDRIEIRLPDEILSNRIRICLDYEAGQISFYALCDPIRHLHTFTAAFTEPLHAVLWLGGGYIKILQCNQKVRDLPTADITGEEL